VLSCAACSVYCRVCYIAECVIMMQLSHTASGTRMQRLSCAAVCCSVLQCVSQCVAVCCSCECCSAAERLASRADIQRPLPPHTLLSIFARMFSSLQYPRVNVHPVRQNGILIGLLRFKSPFSVGRLSDLDVRECFCTGACTHMRMYVGCDVCAHSRQPQRGGK